MSGLAEFVSRELAVQLPLPVTEFAAQIAARFFNSAAVLFYGSCLRTGKYADGLLDFYVLVDDYRTAHRSLLSAFGNKLLPPNVYYAEHGTQGERLRCKYAVMTLGDFQLWCSAKKKSPYIWARFAQPSAIAWVRDDRARDACQAAVTAALTTLVGQTAPVLAYPCDLKNFWSQIFALTYATEFRAERAGKGSELFTLFADRYAALTPMLIEATGLPVRVQDNQLTWQASVRQRAPVSSWAVRRLAGRVAHVARLVKAAFTFDGGVDYLAWKITRHSGQLVEVTDWQRRHPILGSIGLFFRLKRQGAIR